MQRFCVVGLGRFGQYVARQLRDNGCEVLGIDSDRAKVEGLTDVLNTAVIADATDKKALSNLDLDRMDAVVVCLGEDVSASSLAVLHMKDLKAKRIIAKVATEDHAKVLTRLGASDVVFPERDSAIRVANGLTWSNVLDYVPLASGFSVMEAAPPADAVGKSLRDSKLGSRHGVQVIAIHRMLPDEMILAPSADHVLMEEDAIVVLGKRENVEKMLESK